MTLVARVVAPAPFDAAPDSPTCAAELSAHQPRSVSLPRDQIDQYCEVRLGPRHRERETPVAAPRREPPQPLARDPECRELFLAPGIACDVLSANDVISFGLGVREEAHHFVNMQKTSCETCTTSDVMSLAL